jgi:proline iminopeptidase
MANEYFYPPIEPHNSGHLQTDSIHRVYWEECGNPEGEPILFLHGGPGAACMPTDRQFFDPSYFRIVLLDQRGCGRSTPVGEIENNEIDDLVLDIEAIRRLLGIETWHVFGGSWGSTLSLYYSQACPQSCRSLTLRGIWLLRDEEIKWWLYDIRFIQPELWKSFSEFIPLNERGDLLEAYWTRLNSDDSEVAMAAAKSWSLYEGAACTLLPNPNFLSHFNDAGIAWSMSRLEAHYFRNVRLQPHDRLLQNVDTIRAIPAFIVHGRYDIVCPVKNAIDLHTAWPEASLTIVPDAGHSSHEPGITRELVAATDRIRDSGSPALP